MKNNEGCVIVTIIDEDDKRTRSLPVGETLLSALQSAGIPIESICGGQMSCGMCHVYLETNAPDAPPADTDEISFLEANPSYRQGRSRLACQVIVTTAMAGQRIEIVPDL
jgi:2Fe-2S ferredoxin